MQLRPAVYSAPKYARPSLGRLRDVPWGIVALAATLVACGFVGIARSNELVGGTGYFFRKQCFWSLLSFAALFGASWFNYRPLCRWSYLLAGIAVVLLVAVFGFPAINGARCWIRIGGVGFQPSELAKLAFVLALARYLMYRDNFRRPLGLLVPLGATLVPVVLVLREPDLGTALVFLPILLAMLFVAGARRRDLALVILAGGCTIPFVWSQMSAEQRSRVTVLIGQTTPEETPTADGYHLYQAKQMLALGGVWGSFLTGEVSSDLAVYHVPEGATDSIFAILGERFGLAGAALLLTFYVTLVWRILVVAERTREPFGRLFAAGIATMIAVEVLINTGMMVGLVPITGLSLPLVSYGGSGLLVHLIAIGIVLNIALQPGYQVTAEPFRWQA